MKLLAAAAILATISVVVATGTAGAREAAPTGARATPGSASVAQTRVPNLVGKKLPYAEVLLRRAGLRVGREDCDCTFGVVIKSNWYVCQQWPHAGKLVRRGTRVETYSARDVADC